MTDTTPAPRSNDAANDGYEIRVADEHHEEKLAKEARKAEGDVDDKATIRERITDAIKDVIPGDSDHDGH